jgi:hypothetical protein
MNALANLYVAQHLQELLDEAAKERLRRTARSPRHSRIASAATKVMAALAMPLDNRGTMFPKLDSSPNRN